MYWSKQTKNLIKGNTQTYTILNIVSITNMHMILYEINLAQVSLLYYIKVFKFDRFYQLSTNLLNPD